MFPRDRVYAVILNFGRSDDTRRCLASLRRSTYLDLTAVVVDNGSTPDSRQRLRSGLGATTLLFSEDNLGYAGGNNLGIDYALSRPAAYIWLVNPDLEVAPDALGLMVATMEEHPNAGIVGCRITKGEHDPPRVWFNGGEIDWTRGGATSHRDAGRPVTELRDDDRPRDSDYVTGASMLVRRSVFEEIGLLPERYFLYFEETEFNVRAREEGGWDVLVDPRARAHHHQRSHDVLPEPHYVYYFVRNRIIFGTTFTDLSTADVVPHARVWIEAWRKKVAARAPHWLETYDQLVDWAIEDATHGRTGQRPDIASIPHARAQLAEP